MFWQTIRENIEEEFDIHYRLEFQSLCFTKDYSVAVHNCLSMVSVFANSISIFIGIIDLDYTM